MPNEVDDFLKGLQSEPKDDPFAPDISDPFAQKADEKEGDAAEEPEEKAGKPIPFNKDPKVMRFIEKEISKRMAKPEPAEAERLAADAKGDSDEVSEVLSRIIGNDTPEKLSAIRDFKKVLSGLEDKGAQKALRQFQAQAEDEKHRDEESQEELRSGFESIEDEFDVDLTSDSAGARKTRSEFMNYITRIAPKDKDGDVAAFPDFTAAFEEFREKSKRPKESSSRAKDLSSRSMARSADASNAPASADRSWNAVDRLFSKLT